MHHYNPLAGQGNLLGTASLVGPLSRHRPNSPSTFASEHDAKELLKHAWPRAQGASYSPPAAWATHKRRRQARPACWAGASALHAPSPSPERTKFVGLKMLCAGIRRSRHTSRRLFPSRHQRLRWFVSARLKIKRQALAELLARLARACSFRCSGFGGTSR